jgi:uncharacterized membrane protein
MAERKESFVRWQGIAITQLGYAVGLILSFATASLGFALTLIKDKDYDPICSAKVLMLVCLASLITSIALGLLCVLNRLWDFRITKEIAKEREELESQGKTANEIKPLLHEKREKSRFLGERTWSLFWWQIGTFAMGIAALIIAFVIAYCDKIL